MVTLLTGPGAHAHLLAEALRQKGYLTRVVSYFPDWEVRDNQEQRVEVIRVYRWLIWAMWAFWRRLPLAGGTEYPRAWHSALYDWLVSWRVPLSPVVWAWWGTSLYTMRKARQEGRMVLFEAPACHPRTWNAIAKPLYQEQFPKAKSTFAILPQNYVSRLESELKEANYIQVLSSFAKQTFVDHGVPAEKIHILPLGVDTSLFYPDPAHKNEQGKFVVLYVGRIDPLKGAHYLIEAFRRLQLTGAYLWLVGPVLPEMEPILAKYTGENVQYFGPKSQEELRIFYNQASIVIFPTLLDSFGMVILEAMACGKPVIATHNSRASDIFTGKEGIIVEPASVEALMKAIEEMYAFPEEREERGQAAYRRIQEAYTLDNYRDRIEKYLYLIIEAHELA